jgi:hypothetical protein
MNTEGGPCSRCRRFLADNYYQLLPRDIGTPCHDVCPMCFGELHAERGCNPSFVCPAKSCSNIITGHNCHSTFIEKSSDGDGHYTDQLFTETRYEELDEHIDATRIYRNQPVDYQDDHILVTTSYLAPDNATKTASVNVPYRVHCEDYEDHVKTSLLVISRSLFFVLLNNMEVYNNTRQRICIDTISKFEEFARSDPSFIVNFFIQMWTGLDKKVLLSDDFKKNTFQRSNFLALYTGVEQMMRSRTKNPGVLQSIVQRLLNVEQATTAVTSALCKLRISSSRERMRLEDIDKVKEQLIKGWSLTGKKYDLAFVMYDNLGFKVLGARAGYDQYIVIAVQFISSKQLQDIGFYLPPGSLKTPICRERKIWEDIREQYKPENILPSERDYTLMGSFIYCHIDCLLRIINQIPKVEDARRLLKEYGSIVVNDVKLPGDYGSQLQVRTENAAGTNREVEVTQPERFEEDEIEQFKSKSTLLDQPGQEINLDVPMHADLNNKQSVENLTKGALKLRDAVLGAPDSENNPSTDERPIMEDHGVGQGSDGSPSYAFHTLKDDDPEAYANTHIHSGPFHKHLKSLNALGNMFSYTHLWHCLHGHRDTDDKKKFYLFPGDPGQTITEQPEMTAPHYVAAARMYSSIAKRDISAVDVHDWMLERAGKHDICHAILMWLHFVEITNMIQQSEGLNDPDLYRTGATLAMLLFAKTHCTKYIRIGFEEFMMWQTSSDADKKLFDNFYFTKRTKAGKTIFFDRFVEWINKDIRSYLGKHKKPNQHLLMRRTALLMKDRLRRKGEDSASSCRQKYDVVKKEIAISPIFCNQLCLIYSHNFWGEGPLSNGDFHEESDESSFFDPSGEDELNRRLLFLVTDAETALQIRFQQSCLASPLDRKQLKTRELLFRKTPSLVNDIDKEKSEEIIRLTSTDSNKIEKVATVKFIEDRIKSLRESYHFLPGDPKQKTKPNWTKHLADCHQLIINNHPNFVTDIKARMEDIFNTDANHTAKKREELAKMFYRFTEEARNEFKFLAYDVNEDLSYAHQACPQTPARCTRQDLYDAETPQISRLSRLSMD